jgi:hypothetical protein
MHGHWYGRNSTDVQAGSSRWAGADVQADSIAESSPSKSSTCHWLDPSGVGTDRPTPPSSTGAAAVCPICSIDDTLGAIGHRSSTPMRTANSVIQQARASPRDPPPFVRPWSDQSMSTAGVCQRFEIESTLDGTSLSPAIGAAHDLNQRSGKANTNTMTAPSATSSATRPRIHGPRLATRNSPLCRRLATRS